jgi:monofunctional biosynthetic peptidoglycan transglycosylase
MPWRPASHAFRAAAPRYHPSAARGGVRRVLVIGVLIVLLAPSALLLVYRFLPVPITPLMVIRLLQGEGLHKTWVPLEAIAPALPYAVIAAEDNRFCEHGGFDWQELEGQIDALLAGGRARGASTITMQTAKNLFLWPGRDLVRKALEAWFTPQIELFWPKRRIIEVYLNIAEFGRGTWGVEAASQRYFKRRAAELQPEQAALLAAVLPNPLRLRADAPSPYVRRRQAWILRQMSALGVPAILDPLAD